MMKDEKREERVRAEEKYKALVEAAADAIFTLDLVGRVAFVNPAGQRISGYSKEELVGKHFRELLPAKYIPVCLNVFQKALRGQPTPPIEIEMITKKGESVPLELLGRPVKRGRRVVEIIGIGRDIAERKRAEEALRESEEKYRNVAERANDGIVIIQDTIIRYANPRLAEMWGGNVREFIGTPFTDYVHPDELPKLVDRYKRRMAGEDVTLIYETVLGRKDGSKLYAELNAGLITYQGKPADLVIVRDITERKRVEGEIRRHHDELAALNAIAMAVTSTLDLREVLQTIQERAVTLLVEKYPPVFSLFNEGSQNFEVVVTGAHNMILKRAEKLLGVKFKGLTFPLSTLNPALRQALFAGKPYVTSDGSDILGSQVSRRLVKAAQRAMGVNSIVDLPLWAKGKLVGTMVLFCQKEKRSDEEMELISSLASQAAIAIQNARLFHQAQQRIAELATFNEIGRAIASTIKLDQLWELIYHQTCRVMEVSAFYISLYDRPKEELNVVIDILNGQRQPQEEGPRKFCQGRTEYIIHTKKPLLIRGEVQETYERLGIVSSDKRAKAFAGVPITAAGEVIGVLAVQNYERDDAYDEHITSLLSTIANQAAIAIENARLYEETQKRLAETTLLHKVAEIINATLDLKEIFQRVVEELSNAFNYRLVDIYLLEGEALRLQASVGYDAQTTIEAIPLEHGVVGRVARTKEPSFIRDVSQDPDYIPSYPDITSEICVPIKSGETLLGILNVECDKCRFLTENDLMLLHTLSTHIGVAVENARLYEETQHLAITDGLTGLYNLRYFYEALEKEIQRSKRYHRSLSLIILDIDDFKAYNDLYGHLAGDSLLKELAQLMFKVTRQTDTLARYGGEEFAIIMPETEREGAGLVAERLLEEVREHGFSIQDGQTMGRITISLGVATYPHHAHSAKALVDAADKALLRAKQAGKNRLSVRGEELTEPERR